MFEKWEPGQAKVIDKKDITHNATGISRRYAYVVEVLPSSSGGSFRTEIKDPVGGTSIHFVSPGVGQIVAVEVDWRRQRVKLDKDAPGRMDAPGPLAGKHAQDARFAAALAGTKQGDSDASARVDMVATLRMLDAQAASGSITQEQYQAARREAIHQATGVPSAAQESGVGGHGTGLTSDEPAGSQATSDVVGELAKLADLKTQGFSQTPNSRPRSRNCYRSAPDLRGSGRPDLSVRAEAVGPARHVAYFSAGTGG
jgi:hypothetical protein